MSDRQGSDNDFQLISEKMQTISTKDSKASNQEIRRSSREIGDPISSSKQDDQFENVITMERKLPRLNLPEKILFIVDTVHEKTITPYKLCTGPQFRPLNLIKRAIEIFVDVKSTMKSPHEFALMTLDLQSVNWNCDFKNSQNFLNSLQRVGENVVENEPEKYDLGLIFDQIQEKIAIPVVMDSNPPPPHITRIILIYSRSKCIPTFQTGQHFFDDLISTPYVFLDILFVHEPPSNENKCDEVYKELITMDATKLSYILEVGRNSAKLFSSMAQLIAHPLQRPMQGDVNYSFTRITQDSSSDAY